MLLTTIFYHVDNFCKDFEKFEKSKKLGNVKNAERKQQLSKSEVMTIVIFFYHSRLPNIQRLLSLAIKAISQERFSGISKL